MTETLDKDLFRRLVETHSAELTRYVGGFLGTGSAEVADVVQDAFLRLWQKPPVELTAPRAWLFAVCRTKALDALRRRGREVAEFEGDGLLATADDAPTPDRTLRAKETSAALVDLVEHLPARQRELVRLKYRDGLSYAEIATVTGLTATNVGFILHSALATLRARAGAHDALARH